jgi:hypothetical protein
MTISYTENIKSKIEEGIYRILPFWLKKPITFILIASCFLIAILAGLNTIFDFKKNISRGQVAGDNSLAIESSIPTSTQIPKIAFSNNCYTDWVTFTNDYWEGLRSKFLEVNGVYTIPDRKTKFDSVAYYIKSCKGGIKAELKFISFAEKLINLNLYYGTQFRWEVGGNDLRSVKLYKNKSCTANWYGKEVDTENKYLPIGEAILPGQPTSSSLLVFLTADGKLRTELHIGFISPKSGEKVVDDLFYYEFNVGSACDSETVPNIDLDYERIGVGLMRSSYEVAEPPRVKFNEFRIKIYPEKDKDKSTKGGPDD